MGIEFSHRGELLILTLFLIVGAFAFGFAAASLRARHDSARRADLLSRVERDLHEIKTPLTAAKGFIDHTLDSIELNDEAREAIETARENLDSLRETLKTVSDRLAHPDDAHEAIEESVSLDLILRDCTEMAKVLCEQKGLRFQIDNEAELPSLRGSRSEFFTLISQPLLNAIKYTENGHVTVSIKRSFGFVEVGVDDTGIGIPEDELPRVFEPHYRARNAQQIETSDASQGLGLAVVKELSDQIGATVSISRRLPHGTSFRLRIPLT